MPKSTAQILLELEAAGTEWSRNKQFELFAREGPRRARRLRRLLDSFIAAVRESGERGCVGLERGGGARPNLVRLSIPRTGGSMVLHLDDEELAILLRSSLVKAALEEGESGE